MGVKQKVPCSTGDNAELVMASGHEPRGSQSPTLLALPVGALHSPAQNIAEVNDPIPLYHAAAAFSIAVPVDPPALAEGTTTGFLYRLEKLVPRLLVFLASFG
jgi:hypothetical protein